MSTWDIERWAEFLRDFPRKPKLRDEHAAIRACELAIDAARQGTYGVGAVLVDADGEIVVEGHNEVFIEGFRSDLHAEMVVVSRYESGSRSKDDPSQYSLVTSLEPCPMCMTRLIFAGIGTILHVCPDSIGGMVQRKRSLPPVFQEMTKDLGQVWGTAECSEELRDAAFHIWDNDRAKIDRRILRRRIATRS